MTRGKLIFILINLGFITIIARLFYWQIIVGSKLKAASNQQMEREVNITGKRGQIFTQDNSLLVGNKSYFKLYLEPHKNKLSQDEFADKLSPILALDDNLDKESISEQIKNHKNELINKLSKNSKWLFLQSKIDNKTKQLINELNIEGLHFEKYSNRYYPEASMAAHLTGFVGKTENGEDTGYFGVEGAMNKELEGKNHSKIFKTDAFGFILANQNLIDSNQINGRDITLTIRRDLQFMAENFLKNGINRYGAKSGEIVIMDPKNGKILALATWPNFEQSKYSQYSNSNYRNPSLSDIYEPGSTFKALTVAIGIDTGKITPDTQCTRCNGPRKFEDYTIRTWNNQYNPNISMTDALAKSDNTAMIFIAEKIGSKLFLKYLKKFGIGEELNIDLQGDIKTPLQKKLYPVELATASFGQGIGTTSLQLLKAIAVIANKGKMMRPQILEKVTDTKSGQTIVVEPIEEGQVIKPETARLVTKMMINAASHREAQRLINDELVVAGKTGTSQIASKKGGYEEDKTIASFVGFSPPDDPKFIMLVKLTEPTSSPWAAETAVPLWYSVAEKLFLLDF